MEPTVLSELPDEALYHLLVVSDTEQVVRFQRVLGKQRAPVFRQVEKYFQQKYTLYDLSLTQIHFIASAENKDSSAFRALNIGDYPQYISSIYDQLTNAYAILLRAMDLGREESAVFLLEKRSDPGDILIVVPRKCAKCLLYFREKYDFSALLLEYIPYFGSWLPQEKLLWAIETANPVVSAELLVTILSRRGFDFEDDYAKPELVKALIARAPNEELRKALSNYRPRLEYIKSLFEERLR